MIREFGLVIRSSRSGPDMTRYNKECRAWDHSRGSHIKGWIYENCGDHWEAVPIFDCNCTVLCPPAQVSTKWECTLKFWKLSSQVNTLIAAARNHDKWVHIGRVNSFKRLQYFNEIGVDSVDGTYITFGPDILIPKLLQWMEQINEKSSTI